MNQNLVLKKPAANASSADNRLQKRERVEGWDATVFTDDVLALSTEVEDTSSGGAGLLAPLDAQAQIVENTELTLTIHNGQQKITRKAVVRWVARSASEVRFGVQYTDHALFKPGQHQLDIDSIKIDPACALRIPAAIATRRKIMPFVESNGVVHVACTDLRNQALISSIERMVKAPICTWQVEPDKLTVLLDKVYGDAMSKPSALPGKKNTEADNSEAYELANDLLNSAYLRNASDIHIDPTPKGANIRFRVDGQLEMYQAIRQDVYIELAGRLKVLSGMDIAEKRSPQDGRFTQMFSGGRQKIDLRVATLPTKYGERLTLRLLAAANSNLTLHHLGLAQNHFKAFTAFMRRIQGMMILTGPTGSGKTTTLYAVISMLLKERNVNIMTVEDPIEYEIPGAAQCEIDANSEKVSFNSALRSILRHDPDVVMIGEIRDKETAEIAIKASLTGHMVLSTLHTNSAAATITRLIDMGVEPYLVGAALRMSVAQRLLRRLCKHCAISRPMTTLEAMAIHQPELAGAVIYEPTGCIYCANKGYSGRIGLYEVLELHSDWARAVAEGETEAQLEKKMREAGIKSLLQDASDKMLEGVTSYDEVLQVASSW